MRGKISGRRYAQVVFEIAREENQFDEWRDGLKRIVEVMQDAELKTLLESPRLPFETKKKLVEEQLKGVIPSALNLVFLLVIKGRVKIASLIESEYKCLLDAYFGIEHAEVITAVPLDDEGKGKVVHSLENLTQHKVVADFEVDPNIVGGAIVRIGDKLIDGSLKNKLLTLKKSLISRGEVTSPLQ